MKALLEFTLPEEEHEFRAALNGGRAASAIAELDNWLRNLVKYDTHDHGETGDAIYREVREQLGRLVEENNLEFF